MNKIVKLINNLILIIILTSSIAYAEFAPDIILTSPNGIWTDSRAYSSLTNAISAIGSNERTLVITSEQSFVDLTIPSNITLRFERDGSLNNSGTLTLNTKKIIASDRLIFKGSGSIVFTRGTTLRSSWFGTLTNALKKTNGFYDYLTIIISEESTITEDVEVGDKITLKWEGPRNRIAVNDGFTLSNVKNIEAGEYQIFTDSGDIDFVDGTILNLAWFKRIRSVVGWVEDEKVTLYITKPITVDYDNTIPSNITIRVSNGSLLTGTSTLTINGKLYAGRYKIFDENLTVNLHDLIYPEWFGAFPDGNDSWDEFLLAAKSLSVSGGIIYFDVGEYLWGGGTSSFYNGISLIGQGPEHTKVTLINDGQMATNTAKMSGTIDGLSIEKIHFDNSAYPWDDYIRFIDTGPYGGSADKFEAIDCWFTCSTRPFRIAGVTDVRIINNNFYTATLGEPNISIDDVCQNVIITGNIIETATVSSTDLNFSINVQAENMVISDNKVGGARRGGILAELGGNTVIDNNVVDMSDVPAGSVAMYGIEAETTGNVIISNNNIVGRGSTAPNFESGIKINPDSDTVAGNYTVIGNKVTECNVGFWSECLGSTDKYPQLTVEGNSFYTYDYGFYINYDYNITESLAERHITIRNNNFVGFEDRGIYAIVDDNLPLLNITNNSFIPDASANHCIALRYGAGRTVLGGNVSTDNTVPLYAAHWLREMDDTEFENIEFLDAKTVVSDEIDLSSTTQVLIPFTKRNRFILKAEFLYTEASSADAGIYLNFYEYGTSGQGNLLFQYQTESSKSLGYSTYVLYTNQPSAIENSVRAGYEFVRGGPTSAKTGAGKIKVIITYLEDPTNLDVNRY